ncbi:sterol desaturase family protein [Paraliomyxa miuraensis]|uniref:sterol desaturase family protein n=1 Tax=Paraliomyxa miuraensis TaxID=376150 RepID=UPI00225588F0|nr:sterol desaturase family protein [Paraliomyxa miuraensis]MCX4245296.1 sterol desaturase family protein [Paraliomyxa miuraensis]
MNAASSTVAGRRARPVAHDPRAPGLSLRDAFLIFTRQLSARIIAGMLAVALVVRLAVGGLRGWDLVVLVALLLAHPFVEWVIHVGVLHWRPRRLGRRVVDTELAREHRAHHRSPHDPRHWFIPMRGGLLGFWLVAGLLGLVAPTFALWLTFLVGASALALAYEWTHYLCHTSYRPRGRVYKRLWKHHRLHHFKNEHYWMGVTMHMGDRVLHTNPDPRNVETSPTCRNLLGRNLLGQADPA